MKNLKKVLALVIAFSMMLSVAAFASYPDVADNASYKTAVDTLSALNILKGDDLGNFNPDATITRAEVAAVVCRALGLEGSANSAKGTTIFTDVPADFWGSGYINLASQLGIIIGVGDNKFEPDAPVTYAQAVKMLVVALGYEPAAKQRGGWPTGYLVIASQNDMGKGITALGNDDAAARSVVAQLTFNALDIPLMEQTGYGSNVEYTIFDGENNTARKTLLTNKLGVAKLAGQVVANEKVAYTNTGVTTKTGTIGFEYDQNFKNTDEDWALRYSATTGLVVPTRISPDPTYGETNADELVGYRCVVYVKEDTFGDYEIVYIAPQEGKNVSVDIEASDIVVSENKGQVGDDQYLTYLETDDAKKGTALTLSDDFIIIWNNETKTQAALDALKNSTNMAAKVTLIDWNNDDYFDIVKVDEYQHAIVEEVDATRGRIYTTESTIDLKLDEKDIHVTIKDIDGNAVALEDIKADDVLAMISDDPTKDPKWFNSSLDIVVLPSADYKVSGTVDEENLTSATPSIAVDGKTYEMSAGDITNKNQIRLGSTGDFFLGINGKVVGFIGGRGTVNGTLGVIIQAGETTGSFSNGIDIKVINEKGEVAIYTTDKKIKLGVLDAGIYTTTSYDVESGIPAAAAFNGTAWNGVFDGTDTVLEALTSNTTGFGKELKAANFADFAGELAKRVVKYKVNSSNQITEILPATTASSDDDGFFNTKTLTNESYNADVARLDTEDFNSSTVVFDLNVNDIEKTRVTDIGLLVDDAKYTAVLADEVDSEWGAAFIIDGSANFTAADGFAVVTAVSKTKVNDVDAVKVSYLKGGATTASSVIFTDEDSTATDNSDYSSLAIGSVFTFNAGSDGIVNDYSIIGNVSGGKFAFTNDYADKNGVTIESGNEKIVYYYGFITRTSSGQVYVAYSDGTATKEVKFKVSNANQYFYNDARTTVKIGTNGYDDGNVAVATLNLAGDEMEVSYVLLAVVDGSLVDIYSFNARQTLDATDYEDEAWFKEVK